MKSKPEMFKRRCIIHAGYKTGIFLLGFFIASSISPSQSGADISGSGWTLCQMPRDTRDRHAMMVNTSKLFAAALTDDNYCIALCESRSIPETIRGYREKTGETLLQFRPVDEHRERFVMPVIEAIKGNFDWMLVYHERLIARGRSYPAFDRPAFSFLPEGTQWIVVFNKAPDGEEINFPRSDRTLPVLHLASRSYGIIRYKDPNKHYKEPNHLRIDAEAFLSDLKTLVEHVKGDKAVFSGGLKTELGMQIFEKSGYSSGSGPLENVSPEDLVRE